MENREGDAGETPNRRAELTFVLARGVFDDGDYRGGIRWDFHTLKFVWLHPMKVTFKETPF